MDALWSVRIRPMLLARYPGSSPEELRKAHAYAYGGAIIQDMGYYPFGNKFFSDLTHYVRSGDFVTNLLDSAENISEYAFAIGALSHYVSDDIGHRLGTNRAEPLLYPQLRKKYGDVVTYEDDPAAHLKTEFGFDVLEVARGHFAPEAYHDFIGFEVALPVLEKAFRRTYDLELKDLFGDINLSVGSYRRAVSKTVPRATKIAWAQRGDEIRRQQPGITRARFLYNVSRVSYKRSWGNVYERPSMWDKVLAFLFKLIPKIGPLRALAFHIPTPQAEQIYMESFNGVVSSFRNRLEHAENKTLTLPDLNFDVGEIVKPGTYYLADRTYIKLVNELAERKFAGLDETLKKNILAYFSDLNQPFKAKKKEKEWRTFLANLDALKAAPAEQAPGN